MTGCAAVRFRISRAGPRGHMSCVSPGESRATTVSRLGQLLFHAPGRIRRNLPDPVPAMVLGRLAVNKAFHGSGIGTGLLRDAVLRTVQAADIAGIRVILVHAISTTAKRVL
jgi:hypothetical protein